MGRRYHILDEIRGITLSSMILYHAVWDLIYMFGRDWAWYRSDFAFIWQQSICWSFIILSGFCFSLGKKKLRRGLIIFGAGVVISLVTEIAMPENRIRFGVLTLLGSCMLIMAVWEMIRNRSVSRKRDERVTSKKTQGNEFDSSEGNLTDGQITGNNKKLPAKWGMLLNSALFALTKRINYGYLGFANVRLADLPASLYELGDFGSFLGFTENTFYSTDYFSLMPWFFLFLTGFYLHKWFVEKKWMDGLAKLPSLGIWWRLLGKHSLLIYMLHQPLIYVVLYLFT